MRLFVYAALSVALAGAATAQRGGGHAGGGGHGGGGMAHGGVSGGFARGGAASGFRGGSMAGGFRGGLGYNGGLAARGGTYRGNYGFRGFGRGFGRGRFFGRSYFYYGWPYGYGYWDPFFWNDWNDNYPSSADYGYPYSPSYQPPPDITVVSNYGVPQPPPMVIAGPPQPPPPAPQSPSGANSNEPTLYLIAFNDHNIKPVLAYWWDKGTLHYVTMDRVEKTAPLATVDRDMSLRLNEERNVTFSLPNPPPSPLKG